MNARIRNPGIVERIVYFALAMKRRQDKAQLEVLKTLLIEELDSESMDRILDVLLRGMSLLFLVDRDFRTNIRGFNARYAFASRDGGIGASAIYSTGRFLKCPKMEVKPDAIDDANVTVTFKDGHCLAELLLSPRPDIFSGVLDNKLSFSGNMNYLLKFIYMARHVPKQLGITVRDFA